MTLAEWEACKDSTMLAEFLLRTCCSDALMELRDELRLRTGQSRAPIWQLFYDYESQHFPNGVMAQFVRCFVRYPHEHGGVPVTQDILGARADPHYVLADALEEAGAPGDVVRHMRGGVHHPQCWVRRVISQAAQLAEADTLRRAVST